MIGKVISCGAILLFILLAGLSHDPATAQMTDALPEYEEGTVFIFSDGRVERVQEVQDDQIIWATRRGREYVKSPNIAVPILEWQIGEVEGIRTIIGGPDGVWPPELGRSSRFRVRTDISRDGHHGRRIEAWSCRVGKPDWLTVPAGEFETHPVTCDRYSLGTMKLLQRRTWWWSSDVGHYIKRTSQSYRSGARKTSELCAAVHRDAVSEKRISVLANQGC